MLSWFESLVDPYPQGAELEVPRGFFAFLWYCARGMRRYVGIMALFTAVIGAYEAVLFSMLGHMVDWLSHIAPGQLFIQERTHLLILAAILVASPL